MSWLNYLLIVYLETLKKKIIKIAGHDKIKYNFSSSRLSSLIWIFYSYVASM